MEIIVTQNVGIDISKKNFSACICTKNASCTLIRKFCRAKNGLNQLIKWVRKYASADIPVRFTMEATGVYRELLAVHLHKLKFKVSVVLPNKIKYCAKLLNVKTKTDSVDA